MTSALNINGRKRKAKRSDRAGAAAGGGARGDAKDQRNFRQEIWREEDQRRLAAFASLTDELNSPTTRPASVATSTLASSKASVIASQPPGRSRPSTSQPSSANSSASTVTAGSRQPQRPTPARPATASTIKRGISQPASSSAGSRNVSSGKS